MRLVIFGPNGSGKGTQGARVRERLGIPHIESGVIFRDHVRRGTDLGLEARDAIGRGDLVPDAITIPMILSRLTEDDCRDGFLLDGFPRSPAQAEALDAALAGAGMALDAVIVIVLDRETAKRRIMGRRLCVQDKDHPNNIHIDAIRPREVGGKPVCRVCGADLVARPDDQDEDAIDRRHAIYYDREHGTLAAVAYYAAKDGPGAPRLIRVDGRPGVEEVRRDLLARLES